MANKFLIDIDLNGNEIQNFGIQTTGTLPSSPFNGQVVNHNGQIKHYVTGTGWVLAGLTADGTTITDSSGTISVGTITISNVSGLQTSLDGKVDDSQVLTNVPAGAVFTDTTYSSGSGLDLTGTTFSLQHLGFEDLVDPNADRVAFWDDSAGKFEWLTMGSNLTITGTTLNATNTNTTYSAGNGISLTGTTFSVAGGDGLTQEASGLKVDSTVVRTSGAQTIGGTKTFSSDVIVQGDLTVSGAVITTLSEQVEIQDNKMLLNSNVTGTPTENGGIELERGTSANVELLWNESTDRWTFTNDGTNYHNIPLSSEYTNNVGDITGVTAGTGLTGGGTSGSVTVSLQHLGLESLTDPNADRIAFWDDSAGAFKWLTAGSNLTITGTTINATDTNTVTNAFTNIAVSGHTTVSADSTSDTLTLIAGTNVDISTDAAGDSITINATDTNTTYSAGNGIGLSGTTFSVAAGTGLVQNTSGLGLSHLGLESLTDPNADRVAFWDDSAGAFTWLTMGSNLTISGTTLNATNTNTQLSAEQVYDYVADVMAVNPTHVGISATDNDASNAVTLTNQYAHKKVKFAAHSAGTAVITQATTGILVDEYPLVQVYNDDDGQQVATDVVLDFANDEIEVYLPNGNWTVAIHGLRA